tara:strand:- start:663 stop:1934 length:1272 start_codon:yes stop_codon:yes gene_type:complete
VKKVRHYSDYEDYINFQSTKTNDPAKREKWLGEEWNSKIEGFKKEFSKFGGLINPDTKSLCIGARTGQEVVALKEMGVKDVTGIDIVPHLPNVIKGDMHNLDFEENTFDLVYTNVIDHSINPQKMIDEMERVLKPGGFLFLQCQVGIDQDQYTEFVIENPIYDVLTLTNKTFCMICQPINRNFAGMNFEFVFIKSQELGDLYNNHGSISTIEVPEDYEKLWEDINLPIQEKKLDSNNIISRKKRRAILSRLKKRGYYLTRIAEAFGCKDIAEVGTAEGWQYFNFCKYISDSNEKEGTVSTCDPRNVINSEYKEIYSDKRFSYFQETSLEMSEKIGECDFFYIDGLHDQGDVIRDVVNLERNQSTTKRPVWVFDDFDERFGCANDIFNLCQASRMFKVYNVGQTGSDKPSHQVIIIGNFKGNKE